MTSFQRYVRGWIIYRPARGGWIDYPPAVMPTRRGRPQSVPDAPEPDGPAAAGARRVRRPNRARRRRLRLSPLMGFNRSRCCRTRSPAPAPAVPLPLSLPLPPRTRVRVAASFLSLSLSLVLVLDRANIFTMTSGTAAACRSLDDRPDAPGTSPTVSPPTRARADGRGAARIVPLSTRHSGALRRVRVAARTTRPTPSPTMMPPACPTTNRRLLLRRRPDTRRRRRACRRAPTKASLARRPARGETCPDGIKI